MPKITQTTVNELLHGAKWTVSTGKYRSPQFNDVNIACVFFVLFFFSEETPFLYPPEDLFKLYDEVETFVMFIGYPRSSHSLVGAILDAHPEIIIPHEYNVLQRWKTYRSPELQRQNLQKYALFYHLHQRSIKQKRVGLRANPHKSRVQGNYNYNVQGLWQGKYEKRIKVSW